MLMQVEHCMHVSSLEGMIARVGGGEIKEGCQHALQVRLWEDLPENARKYMARIQELIGVKLKWIGVGPGRDALVVQP